MDSRNAAQTVADPICGMSVDPAHAAAASVRGGRTYYFCSATCQERFESNAGARPHACCQR